MAELMEPSTSSGSTPPGKKADKRKQTIIAVAGVAGVLLTYLLWRRSNAASSGASSSAQPYTQAPGVSDTGTGGTASGGADYSGAFNAIGSQLAALQSSQQASQAAQSQYASQEEKFNKEIGGLTHTVSTLRNQAAHQRTTIAHLEHHKGLQDKRIANLTNEVHHKAAGQAHAKSVRTQKKKAKV